MNGQPVWVPACIGLGSNLDDPVSQIRTALDAMAAWPDTRLMVTSGLYANPPMGPVEQPDFVNAVAVLLTRLSLREIFARLQAQEQAQGRQHGAGPRWGPRCIDLDLLACGQQSCATEDLVVPHPGISERNFVLFPLLEICPHYLLPGLGSVSRLAGGVDPAGLEKIQVQS